MANFEYNPMHSDAYNQGYIDRINHTAYQPRIIINSKHLTIDDLSELQLHEYYLGWQHASINLQH